jgi:hypothetical protein
MSRNQTPRPTSGGAPASLSLAFLWLCFVGSWIVSCKDEPAARVCVPGETRLCADVGRCQGSEACLADGSGYGACDCSGPLRQATTDNDDAENPTPYVGRACTADAQCGAGLRCFTPQGNDMFGGGAPGGYCSIECQGNTQCSDIDPQSQCVGAPNAGGSVCLRTCRSQDPTSAAENKCLGRHDLVCNSEVALGVATFSGSRQPGWCFPQCGSNEDCPGRLCNLSRGVCTDTPAPGLPIGEHCENRNECAGGLCIATSPSEAFCSAPCVVDQPIGCGYGLNASPREAACLGPRFTGFLSSEGAWDTGVCGELCAADSDCQQATRGWVCRLSEGAVERFGRPGICGPPTPADAGADGGDAGGTDASAVVDGG